MLASARTAPPLRSPAGRHLQPILLQAVLIGVTASALWYFGANAARNLLDLGIARGFGFLQREAGFEIGETTWLPYDAADTYFRALQVGLLNTLRVSLFAIVLATGLGGLIGLARFSSNWLLTTIATAYVEIIRNVPLVVQLFFLYAWMTELLPAPAQALEPLHGVFLSNRGVAFPIITGLAPLELEYPQFRGFDFIGGGTLSPEFAALLFGLSLYTAAFIAEIVRAGFLSIPRGQVEAGYSSGLQSRHVTRYIVVPQALRVIVPPLTSQYLNCTKNSSLAVAIGYPDLVSVANTTINQTGQAIEGFAIIMLVYLTISLLTSIFMNWYNRRFALRGMK